MINEKALRETLIIVCEHLKKQSQLIASLRSELKVWRETMREMDGDLFAVALEAKRKTLASLQSDDPSSQEYDAIIQQLKDGHVC
jgi:hypothetical protein